MVHRLFCSQKINIDQKTFYSIDPHSPYVTTMWISFLGICGNYVNGVKYRTTLF